ncbi:hypothetical protein F896_01209 [Acinetobacter genomosp. 15BJ]|uniref:Uncharacterized protein n=1 Tax=Acinetobacter genomosp. 15BJ TaxID=106651 RepID=R9B2M8_9GAMM|nr:hypothetical protein [Acinetobacter genomosp. 15BJ]EOR08683.1 hypothetical protein F896_01209 [Acinetobacter genomosp. 15BJ]
MELKDIVGVVDQYFRPLIIVISTAIAIFLSSKKLGNKVSAHYKIVSDTLSAARIDDIVLVNYKDKPVPIFGVYALFKDNELLELELCDPPLVIEPYGSVSVKTKPFSRLIVNGDNFKPDYFEATILLDSVDKFITCKSYKRNISIQSKYKIINKQRKSFNGIVHSGNHPFVLVYIINGEQKTSFITLTGIIENQWDQAYNGIGIRTGETLNERIINDFLIQQGYSEIFTNYVIFKYINGDYSAVLSKSK